MSWFKKIHILGNGPSIKDFPLDIDGIRIGTNFSDAKLKPIHTFVGGSDTLDKLFSGEVVLEYPIIITNKAIERSKLYEKKPKYDNIIVKYIVEHIRYNHLHDRLGLNSAQMATIYGIKEFLPQEVHIWGCDSLWSDDISSSTDTYIPTKGCQVSINKLWRKQWDYLISQNPERTFFIHGKGTPLLQSQSNVRW